VKKATPTIAKKKVISKPRSAPATKSAPAGKAKRQTTSTRPAARKPATKARPSNNGDDSGRLTIGKLDYVDYDASLWNPRKGSTVELIWRALKRHRDNIDKVYHALEPDMWKYISRSKPDGKRRTQPEGEALLRYKINQTRWRFGIQTGQHEKSENRVEYGTGEYATVKKKKPARKPRATTTRATKTTTARKAANGRASTTAAARAKRTASNPNAKRTPTTKRTTARASTRRR
jgi:hypothetical protein